MSLSLTLVSHIPYFCLFQRHLSTLKGLLLTIMNVLGSLLDMGSGIIVSKTEPVLFPFGVDTVIQQSVHLDRNVLTVTLRAHAHQYQLFFLHTCRDQSKLWIMLNAQPTTYSSNPSSPPPPMLRVCYNSSHYPSFVVPKPPFLFSMPQISLSESILLFDFHVTYLNALIDLPSMCLFFILTQGYVY